MNVDLPAPGAPEIPSLIAPPVCGSRPDKRLSALSRSAALVDSTSVMARASERRSPASNAAARSASFTFCPVIIGTSYRTNLWCAARDDAPPSTRIVSGVAYDGFAPNSPCRLCRERRMRPCGTGGGQHAGRRLHDRVLGDPLRPHPLRWHDDADRLFRQDALRDQRRRQPVLEIEDRRDGERQYRPAHDY